MLTPPENPVASSRLTCDANQQVSGVALYEVVAVFRQAAFRLFSVSNAVAFGRLAVTRELFASSV